MIDPLDALLARRIVTLRGPLDADRAGDLCTRLVYLDGSGDEAVTLHLDSPGGPLGAALTVVDTMTLLGVPVDVVALGRVEGSAIGVLVAGRGRLAAPHARFRLVEPPVEASGTAGEMAAWAAHHAATAARFAELVAGVTGRPLEHVEADLERGRWLDAEEARSYGLVQGIWGR